MSQRLAAQDGRHWTVSILYLHINTVYLVSSPVENRILSDLVNRTNIKDKLKLNIQGVASGGDNGCSTTSLVTAIAAMIIGQYPPPKSS